MKLSFKFLLIFAVVLLAGCGKGKTPENPPASAPIPVAEPVVFKKDIETLHKAEALKASAKEDAIEQHKQIEAATQ